MARRLLLSAVFVAMLYWDVATMAAQLKLPVELPVGGALGRYNRMFAVFKSWSPEVPALVARVRSRERRPGAPARWTEHRVNELFPMPDGEAFARLARMVHRDPADLTRQLFHLYQRRMPDRVVLEVRLLDVAWPASPEGLFARYDERRTALIGRQR